jgi:hypothetical protein
VVARTYPSSRPGSSGGGRDDVQLVIERLVVERNLNYVLRGYGTGDDPCPGV